MRPVVIGLACVLVACSVRLSLDLQRARTPDALTRALLTYSRELDHYCGDGALAAPVCEQQRTQLARVVTDAAAVAALERGLVDAPAPIAARLGGLVLQLREARR